MPRSKATGQSVNMLPTTGALNSFFHHADSKHVRAMLRGEGYVVVTLVLCKGIHQDS